MSGHLGPQGGRFRDGWQRWHERGPAGLRQSVQQEFFEAQRMHMEKTNV
jgi:hypothetical protein